MILTDKTTQMSRRHILGVHVRKMTQDASSFKGKTSVFPPAVNEVYLNFRCVSRFNTGSDVCPPDDRHTAPSTSRRQKYQNTNKLQSPGLKVKLVPCNCLLLCMFCCKPVNWSLCFHFSTPVKLDTSGRRWVAPRGTAAIVHLFGLRNTGWIFELQHIGNTFQKGGRALFH